MDRYEGFREFVLARRPALSRTAYLLCGDHGTAEDLVQEALTKTAARWPAVRDGRPEAYVRRAMVNSHISRWRRFGRRERPYGDISAMVTAAEDSQTATTDRLALLSALASLAPKQRAAIVLRFYEGLTETEIAEAMGVARGTVKRNTHDALKRLRVLLPDDHRKSLEAAR